MKTTEEMFSEMLDAVADAVGARRPKMVYGSPYELQEAEEKREEADRRALALVREFFDPIIGDVAAQRLS